MWEAHTQPNLTSETQRPRPEARVCPQVRPGVPHQAFPSTSEAPPSSSCVFLIAKNRPTTPHKLIYPGMMRFSMVMKDPQTLLERNPSPYRPLLYSLSLAPLHEWTQRVSLLPLLSPLLSLVPGSSYPGLQAASLLVTSVGVEPPITSYEVAATYGLDPQRSCLPLLRPPLPLLAPNQGQERAVWTECDSSCL